MLLAIHPAHGKLTWLRVFSILHFSPMARTLTYADFTLNYAEKFCDLPRQFREFCDLVTNEITRYSHSVSLCLRAVRRLDEQYRKTRWLILQ